MEEIKPVLTEKYQFEYRDESKKNIAFSHYYGSHARDRTDKFSTVSSSRSVNFSVDSLMEQIDLVATEKGEFECADESLIKNNSTF